MKVDMRGGRDEGRYERVEEVKVNMGGWRMEGPRIITHPPLYVGIPLLLLSGQIPLVIVIFVGILAHFIDTFHQKTDILF